MQRATHFIVNTLMQRGNRLECVARWLGHRTPTVTYAHYWTDPDAGLVHFDHKADNDDDSVATATDAALYEALQAKVQECEMLRQMLGC